MIRRVRLGLIVPSSNTTMETELPELFRRRELTAPERFSFHSARMRMTKVTAEALAAMDREGDGCARQLADAECDVIAYACLVAIVAAGRGHVAATQRLSAAITSSAQHIPVVTSAGALVEAIRSLDVTRVALIAPYPPPLTQLVERYLADLGIHVVDSISLGVADNRQVGRIDPCELVPLAGQLDLRCAEAIVLSACVQMPSLPAIVAVEEQTNLPVLSAATATAHQLLTTLRLKPIIPDCGRLLARGTGASTVEPIAVSGQD
jgi:maleate isomerase